VRTTLTLDPDLAALLKKAMASGDQSFKDVVNGAIRRGLIEPTVADTPKRRWVQRTWPNGGSALLMSPAEMKQALLDEDTERFLETSRRQSSSVRD